MYNIFFYRRTYDDMYMCGLDTFLKDPRYDPSMLPPRSFTSDGLPNNNYGTNNGYYTTQYPGQQTPWPGQQQTQWPGQQQTQWPGQQQTQWPGQQQTQWPGQQVYCRFSNICWY